MKIIFNSLIYPASLLAGTTIGAGMFALPYLFSEAGIATGLFYLFFSSAVFVLIHLMYADVIVRTPENRRFSGYAKIYLGKFGYWTSIFMAVFGALLILTVYLILSASFINLIAPAASADYAVLFFWFLGSLAVFLSINKLAISEFLIFFGMTGIILIIFGFGLTNNGLEKILKMPLFDFSNVFIPFGAVLFSMYGRSAIPALLGYFRNNGQPMAKSKWPIIIGSVAPALVYAIFVFGILGLSDNVSEDSVSGLVGNLADAILWIIGVLGIISLWSTYIVIGRDIKKSLEHDFNLPLILSGTIIVLVPILLYFIGFHNFLALVGFSGAVIIGLEAIYIILMWVQLEKIESVDKIIAKLNPIIIYSLLFVFIAGIVYKLAY